MLKDKKYDVVLNGSPDTIVGYFLNDIFYERNDIPTGRKIGNSFEHMNSVAGSFDGMQLTRLSGGAVYTLRESTE